MGKKKQCISADQIALKLKRSLVSLPIGCENILLYTALQSITSSILPA